MSPEKFDEEMRKTIPKHNLKCYQLDIDNTESIANTVEKLGSRSLKFERIVANAAKGFDMGKKMPSAEMA